MREHLKSALGSSVSRLAPQARFERCLFVIAHMRCGSTALSNVLCSRPDVSGYGEAHIRYDTPNAVGRLIVNQAARRSWAPNAPILFDKILHNRHDTQPVPGFFEARAVFLARRPFRSIASIVDLYARLGRQHEYPDLAAAARYYIDRVEQMCRLWHQFPAERRVGLTHDALLQDPDASLENISAALAIKPALENHYTSRRASRRGGAGDPLVSGAHSRIEKQSVQTDGETFDLPPSLVAALNAAYSRYLETIETDGPLKQRVEYLS